MPTTITLTTPNQEQDLYINRGDTMLITLRVPGINYTGYTLRCEVRDIFTKRLLFPLTPVLDTWDGVYSNIIISKAATLLQVRAGTYWYDLAVTNTDGDMVTNIMKGKVYVSDDVTLNVANPIEDDDGVPVVVG